jgi:hypothetical protein
VLVEPEQRLPGAAKLLDLVEDQRDRRLNAPVRVLSVAVARLHEANRRGHDQFAPARLLVACRERTLAQKIELVLVEAALQAKQQAVVAVPRRVDRFLVNEDGVDHAAHLD